MTNNLDGAPEACKQHRSARAPRFLLATLLTLALLLLGVASALAAPPEAPVTEPAKEVTATSATLYGELNPLAEATIGYDFAYSDAEGAKCTEGLSTEPVAEASVLSETNVSATATGLEPGKSYVFCLVANNGEGATPGNELPFKTAASKPTIASESASAVTATAATLEAQVNPNDEPTTSIVFEYGTSKTLAGATVLTDESAPLENYGEQTATVPRLEGLLAGTTYFYRVIVKNATGTQTGEIKSFATVPVPFTEAPGPVGSSTVTFRGHLTPLNATFATEYFFFYNLSSVVNEPSPACSDESRTEPSRSAGIGSGTKAVSTPWTGLQPDHEYTVCLDTANKFGTAEQGAPEVFKTLPAPPIPVTGASSEVTEADVTLAGTVNATNQETTYEFKVATNEALTENVKTFPGGEPIPSEFAEHPVTVPVTGLQPRTEYFYRLIATNAKSETGEGTNGVPFTTLAAPLVTTGAATGETQTTALVSGTVNPGGVESTYHLDYVEAARYDPGCGECEQVPADAYAQGHETVESESVGADYTAHPTGPVELSELKPGTLYDYAVVASNFEGTIVGPNMSFTTAAGTPPLVTTGAPSGITQLEALLAGTVDTRGLPTVAEFEFGTSPTVGSNQRYPATEASGGGTTVDLSVSFNSTLTPGTVYYYRVIASNPDGEVAGSVMSFATAGFPAAVAAPAPLAFVPYTTISEIEAREAREHPAVINTGPAKPLTNAQKLAKALKTCRKDKRKGKRQSCEKQAHKKYGPFKKKG